MTAPAIRADREPCLQNGVEGSLTKPIGPDTVAAALARSITLPPTRIDLRPSDGHLDPDRLSVLRELDGGDGELLDAIFAAYANDSICLLAALRDALVEGEPPTIEEHAHTLKGASLNLGATQLAELAGQLETLGRARVLDTAAALLEQLETEYRHVTAALQRIGDPDETTTGAIIAMERFRQAIQALNIPHQASGPLGILTISVGIATWNPTANLDSTQLLETADAALDTAKERGRNQTATAQPESQPAPV